MFVETLYITDINYATTKKHDVKIGSQVVRKAADLRSLARDVPTTQGYSRNEFHRNNVRPLIKHRICSSLDHAHNARMDIVISITYDLC